MPREQKTAGERLAVLEAQRKTDIEERDIRRSFLDGELKKIFDAIADLKDWVRIQFYGNGKRAGCFDERLNKVERFVDAFDWRRAVLGRILAYAIQGILLVALLKLLKLA